MLLEKFHLNQSDFTSELLHEKVVRVLVDAIVSGKLEGGQQLVEVDLQQYFGISKTPLREAFRELEQQGFVESFPRRGSFVRKIEARDAEEVYLVRVNLEGMAGRLAYENMTPECLQELQCELDGMEEGAKKRDSRAYLKHHDTYHNKFIQQGNNRTLIEILERLRRQTNWHRFYFSYHDSHFGAALNSHRHIHEMFNTVGLGGDKVESIIRMHILEGFNRFKQHISSLQKEK